MAYQHEGHSQKRVRRLLANTGHHHGMHGGHFRIGGSIAKHADAMQDKREIDKAVREGIAQHEEHDHRGEKRTRLRLRDGGMADGAMSDGRADQAPRGKGGKGKGGAKNHIAIVIAPQGGGGAQQPPQRVPVPVPAARPPMPPPPGPGAMPPGGMPPGGLPPGAGAMPPRPPMPPPGGAPGGMPPGGMPMMRKAGGRTSHMADSMAARTTPPNAQDYGEKMPMKMERPEQEIETAEGQRRGGRSHHAGGGEVGPGRVKMSAGSGSGEGRLQKSRALEYCEGGKA